VVGATKDKTKCLSLSFLVISIKAGNGDENQNNGCALIGDRKKVNQ
ncbi:unnamed protein product, partial [Acidithrix sp. C25]